jgi:hypothetical protein
MPLIPTIINWFNVKRMHQINLFRDHPVEVQEDVLMALIQKSQHTEWGRSYGFDKIKKTEDFKKRVPLHTYEELKPTIDRIRNGEENILWPGEIKWFAKSSGTTGNKSKFIPMSKEALEECHFRGGKDALVLHCNNFPETRIFKGKGLTLGGSQEINKYSNQSYYGDLSAILINNIPFWADFIRTPPQKIALLDDWDQKLDEISRATVQENVTNLAGVPSWNLVLIHHILKHSGKDHLLEIWPNLELFIHGGVSFKPYRAQFEKLIPSPTMNYMETYNASEGFFAIQDDPATDDMLLMLDYGIYYEFIPMRQYQGTNSETVSIGGVVPGENYAMVITTNGGLWRYIIGDTVVFSRTFPHKLRISGRTKHYMNAFGEELIVDNAEKALSLACEKTNARIYEYTAAPIFMSGDKKGTHEWVVEFEKEPDELDYFTDLLDHALMSVNSDYEAKRYKDITLVRPTVRSVRKGTFYRWFQKKGKLGGQNKIPRLSNERTFVEEVLAIALKQA